MSSKYFNLFVFLGALLLFVASCHKTDYKANGEPALVNVSGSSTDKTGLNKLFSALRPAPATLTVTAGIYQVVRAPQGTKLTFYPNSFTDKSGKVISSGTIQIAITEMYRPGAMIANRATTTGNGNILKSGGQVYITATKNGADVSVNKYGLGFIATQPGHQTMALFYGNTSNADSLATWPIAKSDFGMITSGTIIDTMLLYIVDTSGSVIDTTAIYRNYNQFDSTTSLSWVNCDFYLDSGGTLCNVAVIPSDTSFNASNTEIFIVLPGYDAVAAVNNYDATTHTFTMNNAYKLYAGIVADVIAIGSKGGNLYYYEQKNVSLTPTMTFTPVMMPRSVSYIRDALSVL